MNRAGVRPLGMGPPLLVPIARLLAPAPWKTQFVIHMSPSTYTQQQCRLKIFWWTSKLLWTSGRLGFVCSGDSRVVHIKHMHGREGEHTCRIKVERNSVSPPGATST